MTDLRGKTIATAGIPYQAAYLDTILERSGSARTTRRWWTSNRGCCPRFSRARRRDAGRVPERRGGRSEPPRGRTRRCSRWTGLASRRTTSWCWSRTPIASTTTRATSACSSPRSSGARTPPSPTPKAATETLLEAGNGLDPKLHGRSGATDDPPAHAGEGQGVRLHGPEGVAALRQFFADDGLIEALPSAADVLTNDLLPGRDPGVGRRPAAAAVPARRACGEPPGRTRRPGHGTARRERRTPPLPRSSRNGGGR